MMGTLRGESGGAMLQILIIGVFVTTIALYFSSKTVSFKVGLERLKDKNRTVDDRKMLEFDLATRPFPTPTP